MKRPDGPDIACGYFLGETSCVLRYRHDGDHQPADTVVVDRYLRPINRCRVRLEGKRRRIVFANVTEYKGRIQIILSEDEEQGAASFQDVRRPAVRVGDLWLRRVPNLEVVG